MLSPSFLLCSSKLVAGGALHTDEGLFIGLTATLFTWEPVVLDVEVGRPPFLPEESCALPAPVLPVFLGTGLTTGLIAELFGLPGGGGLQSGGGMGLLGEHCWDFFPLVGTVAAFNGDEAGDVVVGGSWGMLPCGDEGGVWKLSKGAPVFPWLSLVEKLPILYQQRCGPAGACGTEQRR